MSPTNSQSCIKTVPTDNTYHPPGSSSDGRSFRPFQTKACIPPRESCSRSSAGSDVPRKKYKRQTTDKVRHSPKVHIGHLLRISDFQAWEFNSSLKINTVLLGVHLANFRAGSVNSKGKCAQQTAQFYLILHFNLRDCGVVSRNLIQEFEKNIAVVRPTNQNKFRQSPTLRTASAMSGIREWVLSRESGCCFRRSSSSSPDVSCSLQEFSVHCPKCIAHAKEMEPLIKCLTTAADTPSDLVNVLELKRLLVEMDSQNFIAIMIKLLHTFPKEMIQHIIT
ncbi:hypothetical protein ACTXT7_011154 [Hymenolepis weldensis]